jgi:hypothetical protein
MRRLPDRPFSHDAERTAEAQRLETPPEFSAFAATRRPFSVQPRLVRFKWALPNSKNVTPFAADHVPYELPTMAVSKRVNNSRAPDEDSTLIEEVELALDAVKPA